MAFNLFTALAALRSYHALAKEYNPTAAAQLLLTVYFVKVGSLQISVSLLITFGFRSVLPVLVEVRSISSYTLSIRSALNKICFGCSSTSLQRISETASIAILAQIGSFARLFNLDKFSSFICFAALTSLYVKKSDLISSSCSGFTANICLAVSYSALTSSAFFGY